MTKLNLLQILNIKARIENGESALKISKDFKISSGTIGNSLKRIGINISNIEKKCKNPECNNNFTIRERGKRAFYCSRKCAIKHYSTTEKGLLVARTAKRKYKKTEKGKEAGRRYRQGEAGKAAIKRHDIKAREKYPEKIKARHLANDYLDNGRCIREGCNIVGEKHHPDYNKPFEIIYLCGNHHKDEHERIKNEMYVGAM